MPSCTTFEVIDAGKKKGILHNFQGLVWLWWKRGLHISPASLVQYQLEQVYRSDNCLKAQADHRKWLGGPGGRRNFSKWFWGGYSMYSKKYIAGGTLGNPAVGADSLGGVERGEYRAMVGADVSLSVVPQIWIILHSTQTAGRGKIFGDLHTFHEASMPFALQGTTH